MKIEISSLLEIVLKYPTLLPFKLTYCVEHIEYSLGNNDDSNIIHVSTMSMMTNYLPNWLWLKIGLTLKKVNEGQLLSMICIIVSNLYCLWFMGNGKGHVCSFIIEVSSRGAGFGQCSVQSMSSGLATPLLATGVNQNPTSCKWGNQMDHCRVQNWVKEILAFFVGLQKM